MSELDGKVALITGGARGIGASIAKRFVREGARVVVNDSGATAAGTEETSSPVEAIVRELNEITAGSALGHSGDVADPATGQDLVDLAVKSFGGLHIVVNSAGILRDKMIFNLEPADWDAVIRVHLRGHYSTLKPAAAYWRSEHDNAANNRIINLTSISGIDGSPGQPNYSAAKAGIIGLTYSLAHGLARYGVTANAIAPGAATRMVATVADDRRANSASRPADDDPARSPDNVAPVALYLASDRSRWLSGRVISAVGYEVGLYRNPEIQARLLGTAPWEYDRLATAMEAGFQPHADGLPPNWFSTQTRSNASPA